MNEGKTFNLVPWKKIAQFFLHARGSLQGSTAVLKGHELWTMYCSTYHIK